MKLCNRIFFPVLIWMMVGIVSCSDDSEPEVIPVSGKLVAGVFGQYWVSEFSSGVFMDGHITINASNTDGSRIAIVVAAIAEGTYEVNANGNFNNQIYYWPADPSGSHTGNFESYASTIKPTSSTGNTINVGEINITEIDPVNRTVSGTFHSWLTQAGTANTMELKSGSFTQVSYTEYAEIPADCLNGEVDGEIFLSATGLRIIDSWRMDLRFAGIRNGTIYLTIPLNVEEGEYSLSFLQGGSLNASYLDLKDLRSYDAVSGSISITSHDKVNRRITATFGFTGQPFNEPEKEITFTACSFELFY